MIIIDLEGERILEKGEDAIFFPKNSKILARLIGMIFYEFDPTAITKYFIHVENSNQL